MNDEQEPERSPLHTRRRAALGYDARSERRALRGAARRRKLRTKLWLTAGPAVVVIAIVVTLLLLFGGQESENGTATTSTTVAPLAEESAVLVVEQAGAAPVILLLQTGDGRGLVLGMSGITLMKSADGFQTLSDMYVSGEDGDLAAALSEALEVNVRAVASVAWTSLRSAMAAAGIGQLPEATLAGAGAEPEQIARAVTALMDGADPTGATTLWEGLQLGGDSSTFRALVGAAATSGGGGGWSAAALTGPVVEGEGFKYLEPEVDRAKALLLSTKGGATITVEVKNGSGAVGAVEQAMAQLELLGHTSISAGNSEDFPNVRQTRIVVPPGAADAGVRIKVALGVGTITEDMGLQADHVTVVLGSDYVPPAPAGTGSTG